MLLRSPAARNKSNLLLPVNSWTLKLIQISYCDPLSMLRCDDMLGYRLLAPAVFASRVYLTQLTVQFVVVHCTNPTFL